MPRWTVKASLFSLFAIYCIWMMMSWDKWNTDDGTVTKLMVVLGAAIFFGLLTVLYLIPMIGELSASFFYSSGELIETDEDMRGAVLLAQGNYEGAVAAYTKNAEKNPDARFPVVEISKIYLENLKDPEASIQVLHSALEREWDQDDAAFFLFRIADIQSDHLADFDGARETLQAVIEQIPDSRHSANATHKFHEVDEKELVAKQRIARGESPIPLEEEEPKLDPKEAARLQREKEEADFLAMQQGTQSGKADGDGGQGGSA